MFSSMECMHVLQEQWVGLRLCTLQAVGKFNIFSDSSPPSRGLALALLLHFFNPETLLLLSASSAFKWAVYNNLHVLTICNRFFIASVRTDCNIT